jgi:uncharacterized protein (TIGR02996 family)
MHEETAFLRGIEGAPDDAALRLAYADWLDERGEAQRAECIRVEAAMAALPAYSDRYQELKPRRTELRAALEPEWLRQMGYVPRHRPMFTKLPKKRADRWHLVAEFIEIWYRTLKVGDGNSEAEIVATEERLGFRLPAALREWYALAGNRRDVWSKQDYLIPLDRLDPGREQGALVFYRENQNCEWWGILESDLGRADPPIHRFRDRVQVSRSTSAFAVLVLLHEAKFGNDVIWAGGEFVVETSILPTASASFAQCDIPNRYWCADPIFFFEGSDFLLEVSGEMWVYLAARNEQAYRSACETLGETLDRF